MSFGSSLLSPPMHIVYRKQNRTSRTLFKVSANVPDFLSADWFESRKKKPFGPRLDVSIIWFAIFFTSLQKMLFIISFKRWSTTTNPVKIMELKLCIGLLDLILLKGQPILAHSLILVSLKGSDVFFTILLTESYWVTKKERSWAVCLWRRTNISSGFGFEEVDQRKRRYFNLQWFRGLAVAGMVIGWQSLCFTTGIHFLVGWHIDYKTFNKGVSFMKLHCQNIKWHAITILILCKVCTYIYIYKKLCCNYLWINEGYNCSFTDDQM